MEEAIEGYRDFNGIRTGEWHSNMKKDKIKIKETFFYVVLYLS